jgi:cobalamin biosynthesis protein CobC
MDRAGFAHHGGRLGAARVTYPQAPQPWIDLSTGINPRSYRATRARGVALNRLPDTGDLQRLESVAAEAFGVDVPGRVVAAGGTESALRLLPYVLRMQHAVVAGPTYGSHADAWSRAGTVSRLVADAQLESSIVEPGSSGGASAMIIVNPNNPDGRIIGRERLRHLHDCLAARGGVLIVDEAFAEVTPGSSVADIAGTAAAPHLLVLRSFGKFYGLAGVRLGFVVGSADVAARVRGAFGDWPVSVDALVAGLEAYPDRDWADRTRARLARDADRLDRLLAAHGFEIVGGTSLYRLVCAVDARTRFEHLAAAGILTRPFEHDATLLRFGLPGTSDAWRRLAAALVPYA